MMPDLELMRDIGIGISSILMYRLLDGIPRKRGAWSKCKYLLLILSLVLAILLLPRLIFV